MGEFLELIGFIIGYWLGFTGVIALIFYKKLYRKGSYSGDDKKVVAYIILSPIAAVIYAKGVDLAKKRKNNLSSFTSEELEKQYKKRLISPEEYDNILKIKEKESLEKQQV